ncbi:putative mitochondrial protein, partial [Tanacetum coccineum]
FLVNDVTRLKNGEGSSRFSRLSKLEFPKFYGEDVKGWMYKVEQFFTVDEYVRAQWENATWPMYEKAILKRFGENQVEITEARSVSMYIAGLPPTIEMNVRMFKPGTLVDAFSLSNFQETALALPKQRYTPLLPTPRTTYENRNATYPAKPITTTLKYMLGHKCNGQIFVLEVSLDDREDLQDSIDTNEEEELGNPTENGELLLSECYASPQISLNAISGTPTFNTIRMKELVAKHILHLLMDTGSTHNFLNLFTTNKLGCKLTKTYPLQVTVAEGNKMISEYMVYDFRWSIQGYQFKIDVMLLPLGGCEMVLGIQWLSTLGNIQWNFHELVMKFVYEGKNVYLRKTKQFEL